jgi:hypothetical protein
MYSANAILSILLERIPAIDSAIDVGCGVGTWLSVLKEKGIKDIKGIDGNWVDQGLLVIPKNSFQQVNLNKRLRLSKRYDLAISLEVAEHLPRDCAQEFVLSLTEMSDFVLFSAAIPFQGGINHINEQWQHHWVELFATYDYVVHDFIRANIWNDSKIPFWYRQNVLFFSTKGKKSHISSDVNVLGARSLPLDIVHPELFLSKSIQTDSVRSSLRALQRSLKGYIRRSLRRYDPKAT